MLVLYVKKLILSVYRQKSVARSFCYWMPVLFQRRPIETKRSAAQKKIDRTRSTSITTHCDILQSTGTVVLSKLERFRLRLVTEVMITKRQPRFSDTSGLLRSILFSYTIIGSSMAIERSPAPKSHCNGTGQDERRCDRWFEQFMHVHGFTTRWNPGSVVVGYVTGEHFSPVKVHMCQHSVTLPFVYLPTATIAWKWRESF